MNDHFSVQNSVDLQIPVQIKSDINLIYSSHTHKTSDKFKEMKDLYNANYKAMMKEIEKTVHREKVNCAHTPTHTSISEF